MSERFEIRLSHGPGGWFVHLFGARPGRAHVDVGDGPDGEVDAVFGRFRVRTPLANVTRWRIEGPFRPITALGVRRSVRHADVTFGGSAHGGVRMDFRSPVRIGPLPVPALYVSADDLDALAAALRERGIPGEDARR
jgi:hypothetical protein